MSGETKEAKSRLVPLAAAMTALATMVGAVLSIPGLKETLGSLLGGQTPAASASPAALASGAPGAMAGGNAPGQPQRAAAARTAAGGAVVEGGAQGFDQGGGQDAVQATRGDARAAPGDHAAHDPAPEEPAAADPPADTTDE